MNDLPNVIRETLSSDDLLSQLEEECAELIQAASKLRRAMGGSNPTPVTVEEAQSMIVEEFADVLLCLQLLGYSPDDKVISDIQNHKRARWVSRITTNRR